MKILMFGRGVISTLYGHALEMSGHSVEFYVRPGRITEYGPRLSVNILDARTKFSGVPVVQRLGSCACGRIFRWITTMI